MNDHSEPSILERQDSTMPADSVPAAAESIDCMRVRDNDQLKTPGIWITNNRPGSLAPSSRRRFDYSIEFKPLPHQERLQVWKNARIRAAEGNVLPLHAPASGVRLAGSGAHRLWYSPIDIPHRGRGTWENFDD